MLRAAGMEQFASSRTFIKSARAVGLLRRELPDAEWLQYLAGALECFVQWWVEHELCLWAGPYIHPGYYLKTPYLNSLRSDICVTRIRAVTPRSRKHSLLTWLV